MGMINELPTKLDYEDNRTISKGLHNVFDFQRLNVKLWNQANLTVKEQRLFDKLRQWNNVNAAREHGCVWCLKCKDHGYLDTPNGRFVHSCAATSYSKTETVFLTRKGKVYEEMIAKTPKKCFICGSEMCSLVTDGRQFYYVCDFPKCQDEINKRNEEG